MTAQPSAQDVLDALHGYTTRLTEVASHLKGLSLNHVLRSETIVLGSQGRSHRDTQVPYASVGVWAYDSSVTVVAGPNQGGDVPTRGIGVIIVPAQKALVWPLAGTEIQLYGTAGARVLLTLFSAPQVPSVGGTSSGIDGGGA